MEKCSFCNKDKSKAKKLIAGNNVYICDSCVDICSDVIHQAPSANTEPSFEIIEQTVYCALLQNYDDRTIKDMKEWIKDNIEESWIRVYNEPNRTTETYKIFFNNESDLVAFKLRWI